jgi:pyruvate,water dikinase
VEGAIETYILWLTEVDKEDIALVGGKGANLGEMAKSGIPVPPGFIVTSQAYFSFLDKTKLKPKIKASLQDVNPENTRKLNAAAKEIQKEILSAKMPPELIREIEAAYGKLGEKIRRPDPYVAVRSSATAEDLPDASFAGQQETYLNVRGKRDVVSHVKRCWASLFAPRAIYYRVAKRFDHFKVGIAVPVQRMVQADKSGVLFTVDPVTGDRNKIIIEAGWGLGEAIVSGAVTPDRYIVDKKTLKLLGREVHKQTWKVALTEGGDRHVAVPAHMQNLEKLSDTEITELARIARNIEAHYAFPQDTEWAIESGEIFFVQARPVTTLKKPVIPELGKPNVQIIEQANVILEGIAASIGLKSGPVKIIHGPSEIDRIMPGDVLVTEMTNPSFVPAMRRTAAIVTDTGGQTSHAAIVSRELGIPCVVGTGKATSILKTGMVVTVDGSKGLVYQGDLKVIEKSLHLEPPREPTPAERRVIEQVPVTGTKVYVNLGEPFLAEKIAQLPVDGVGLLRAEFIVASLGEHPHYLVAQGRRQRYVDGLVDGIETIARAFHPRPVVYRGTDFKTNEYRGLKGGEKFEPREENPMIGYRGVLRYLKEPEYFRMELEAIQRVRNRFDLKNVWMMIPMVRTINEFLKVREMMQAAGLKQSRDFKLWIMCEVPSTVMLIEEYCKLGIDGVSIGSNDLTQFTLGVDRDNQAIAEEFDERDPAVMRSMQHVVSVCRRFGISSSICGQAPSVYPEVTEALVEVGITSISVNPDVAVATRKLIASVEKRILLRKAIAEQEQYLPPASWQ